MLNSCSRKINPMNQIEPESISIPRVQSSNINLPIYISEYELHHALNQIIAKYFASDLIIENKYKVFIKIKNDLKFRANQNQINYSLPLEIEILPLADINQIKAKGELMISLNSAFSIFNNQLLSKTEYSTHTWIKSPQLYILNFPIPISSIADAILFKLKTKLCNSIDETIQQSFKPEELRKKILQYFQNSIASTEDNILNIYATPGQLGIGPFDVIEGKLEIPVVVNVETILSSKKPQANNTLFNFEIFPKIEDQSDIKIHAEIPMQYIEQLCRENIQNQTYGSGITKLKVQQIKLSGYKETLQVNLITIGAYNGELLLSFVPSFNSLNKTIEIDNLSIKTISGKFIDKAVFNIAQSYIQSKLKSTLLDFFNGTIQEYTTDIKNKLSGTEVFPGSYIKGELLDYQLSNFVIIDQLLYFHLNASLKAHLDVLEFPHQFLK